MKKIFTNKFINISIICILVIILSGFNFKNKLFEKYSNYEFEPNYTIIDSNNCKNSLKCTKPVCVIPKRKNLSLFNYFMKIKSVFI